MLEHRFTLLEGGMRTRRVESVSFGVAVNGEEVAQIFLGWFAEVQALC